MKNLLKITFSFGLLTSVMGLSPSVFAEEADVEEADAEKSDSSKSDAAKSDATKCCDSGYVYDAAKKDCVKKEK